MSHLRIPDHLGLCEVDRRILMLDLRRDRYLELDRESADALRRWRGNPAPDPSLARLVELGILIGADRADTSGWTVRATPGRSLLDRDLVPGRAGLLVPEVAMCLWAARRRLRLGLETAVAAVRKARPREMRADFEPQLARFAAARRMVPLPPHCLTDSLALAAFLARRDIAFELVFGVKLDPFAAHCWLQIGNAVANDSSDSVACFTPILVA